MHYMCEGLHTGRPFGGVAILYKKHLDGIISFVAADDGRVVCVKLITNDVHLLIFGCYFPYNDHSMLYTNAVSSVVGFIESVIDDHPGFKACIIGDLNFECYAGNSGYESFQELCICA